MAHYILVCSECLYIEKEFTSMEISTIKTYNKTCPICGTNMNIAKMYRNEKKMQNEISEHFRFMEDKINTNDLFLDFINDLKILTNDQVYDKIALPLLK